MPTTKPRRSLDELAALGGDIFDRQVRPALRPEDDGKFVAIDVETGSYCPSLTRSETDALDPAGILFPPLSDG